MQKHLYAALMGLSLVACGDAAVQTPGEKSSSDAFQARNWQPEWAPVNEARLRPGAQLRDESGAGCTFNFLYVDPVSQAYYIGSAAHCHDGENNEDGMGNRVTAVGMGEIGTVVFDSDSPELQKTFGVEDRVDFSLIALDPGVNLAAHPETFEISGPTDYVDCNETQGGDIIIFHGYGMVFGDVFATRTRRGAQTSCDGKDFGAATNAIFGDSGGPVLYEATGAVAGIVSRLGIDQFPPTELAGATMPYIFRELAKAGFGSVALATIDGGFVGAR